MEWATLQKEFGQAGVAQHFPKKGITCCSETVSWSTLPVRGNAANHASYVSNLRNKLEWGN